MFELETPSDKPTLVESLGTLHQEIGAYFESFSTAEFFAPQGDAWSPDTHLRHLTSAVRPLARALALPRLVLAARFWIARGGSRSFEQIVSLYQSALAEGAQARGAYLPSQTPTLAPAEADQRRLSVLEWWQTAGRDLAEALAPWSEQALDRYRIPHPLLGKMTVREMLLFTLYHNAHHARRVKERAK